MRSLPPFWLAILSMAFSSGFPIASIPKNLSQLSETPDIRMRVAKIIFLIFLIGFVTFFIIRFFHLEKLVFRGPKTVVELITDTGLKSDRGHVNILLLGIGGAGHEGPDLSDTMILASVNKNGDDVVLVSIPRDLWAPNLAAKINTAYAFGQEKDGRGLELAKK